MGEMKAFHWVRYIFLVVVTVVVVFSVLSTDRFWQEKNNDQPEKIKEAIEKACIQCYALEGSYPPDLDYLKKNYGIILDHERYFYHYEIFASNIMPYVEVYGKEE